MRYSLCVARYIYAVATGIDSGIDSGIDEEGGGNGRMWERL